MKMLLAATLLALLTGSAGPAYAQSPGDQCDRLAGAPEDPERIGDGVKFADVDVAAAEEPCRKAAEAQPNLARYQYELGRVLDVKEDYAAALPLYEKAAGMGYAMALVSLGLLYENGYGVDRDYARAADYYRKASDAGVEVGTWNLANLMDQGKGVPENPAEAARLFRRGVEAGDPFASTQLGWLYAVGRGVAKDEVQAERLFRQAMAGNDPEATADANNLLAYMWAMAGNNLAEAERLARAARDAEPTRDEYLDTLALVYLRQGRNEEAATLMRQVIAKDGDYAPYHERLGDIYAALGKSAEAKAEWHKALDLPDPDYFDPEWDRGAIQKKLAAAQ